jgi:tetratricopeptide (TPR) repeat protein
MIAGEHFEEEFLIFLAEGPAEKDTHPHLIDCADCRSSVDEYRTMLTSFAEESTWDRHPLDETPNPQTIATLRAFVDRTHHEDAEAEPLVAELLAGPREEWMPRLMADAKYRTAGVVRKLIAATDRAIQTMPPDAIEISMLACRIAEELSPSVLTNDSVLRLQSSASRELGFSLFYVGRFDEALAAQDRSEVAARASNLAESDIGRALLLRALIFRQTDALNEALELTREAEQRFRTSADQQRETVAISTRAYLMSKIGDYKTAISLTRQILSERATYISSHEAAVLSMNLGVYSRELGDINTALEHFKVAAFAFDELGIVTEAARMRWNIAVLLKANGDLDSADRALRHAIEDFQLLGMHGTAAVATVDLAEVRILQRRPEEVAPLCRSAMQQFESGGIAYSSRALAALALLREAAESPSVPIDLVKSVRNYLVVLPSQPTLEFAYAPHIAANLHQI